MASNEDDHVKESNVMTEKEDPRGGNVDESNKEEPLNNRENISEISNVTGKKDQPMKKTRVVYTCDEDREVGDILSYAEKLKPLLVTAERLKEFKDKFTSSQREVFEEVMEAVKSGRGRRFFVEARHGRMKLDLLNAILAAVRLEYDSKGNSAGDVVGGESAIATSCLQLAANLLLGGRTFHYMFNASLDVTEDSSLQITKGSISAAIFSRAKIIVVDEAVSLKKCHLEQLDEKLRELTRSNEDFGNKVVVLSGNFRQLLPIGKEKCFESVINRSSLWSKFDKFTLLAQEEESSGGNGDQFDKWLQMLGNGDIPFVSNLGKNCTDHIELPEDMCMEIQTSNREGSLNDLINFVFQSFENDIHKCAIIAPTIAHVKEINDACMKRLPGTLVTCLSEDTLTECTCELNPEGPCPSSEEIPGVPPHRLDLKPGAPLILLASIHSGDDNPANHGTGTRLIVKSISKEALDCVVATVQSDEVPEDHVYIKKIPLQRAKPDDASPDGEERCQFPVQVAFATTIHKSQGMMLKRAGVWLEKDVLNHGQLYTAASCVERKQDIKFALHKRTGPPYYVTRNVVRKEVFETPEPPPAM